MAAEHCLQPLIGDEFDVGCSAPSERRDEHRQPVVPAPDSREVNLHLTPWVGLERRDGGTRAPSEQNAKIADCLADEAVSIEPVSGLKFPVKQGKNREFLRFPRRSERLRHEKPWNRLDFFGEFPTQRNREFSLGNRDLFRRIREFTGADQVNQ